MSMKRYGIFLAYGPLVDLRYEGLGRHLAAFLRAAQESKEFHLTIACPQWMGKNLQDLCLHENIDLKSFTLVTPSGTPVVLSALVALRSGPRVLLRRARSMVARFRDRREIVQPPLPSGGTAAAPTVNWLATIRHWWILALLSIVLSPLVLTGAIAAVVLGLAGAPLLFMLLFMQQVRHRLPLRKNIGAIRAKIPVFLKRIPGFRRLRAVVGRYYHTILASEIVLVADCANRVRDVSAWYCPAAFWPEFNRIGKPRLICVPDIVTGEFPAGFALATGEGFYESVRAIEKAIEGSTHFITYSEGIKWGTLVKRYYVDPDAVRVVRHAPNILNSWIQVAGLPDPAAASRRYCETTLLNALYKSHNSAYVTGFRNGSCKFIFYASQFRPNKNVLNLLRAYLYLLRRRYVQHKLVLTGNPQAMPDIAAFIQQHRLQNDVLCLHGLSTRELAACYRLADLAVNPSLSEGGCPFTFTEALSVNTPVVMARIPVTMEVLDDPELESSGTFFDPYDWKAMAACIESGLKNREALLAAQKPVYDRLAQRDWRDVVDDYVAALDAIAASPVVPDVSAAGGKAA